VEFAMSTTTLSNPRLAWQNRWSEPGLETLLGALKPHHRRAFNHLMQQLEAMEGVSRSLIWYGPGWKWTLQYLHTPASKAGSRKNGRDNGHGPATPDLSGALCYLVPDSLMPVVCVPLRSDVIGQLPLKRLSKYIRDGIAVAKCAVAIHWAIWYPVSDSDVGLLMDLVKRKHTITNNAAALASSTAAGSTPGSAPAITTAGSAHAPAASASKARSNGSSGNNGHAGAKVAPQMRPTKKIA
jgi:hypothetical protein